MTWKLDILTFHRVLPRGVNYFIPPMSMARDTFSSLMQVLASRYQVVSLEDAAVSIRRGDLQGKAVCLTFDDGYVDNFEYAAKILLQLGLPATFFVPVHHIETQEIYWWDYLDYILRNSKNDFCKWVRKKDWSNVVDCENGTRESRPGILAREMVQKLNSITQLERDEFLSSIGQEFGPYQGSRLLMNQDELNNLVDSGFEIGSHTISHTPLTDLDLDQARDEIFSSRERLHKMLSKEVNTFCYPRGAWSYELAGMVEQAGYSCAVTTAFGSNMSAEDLFFLKRRNMADYQGIRSRFPVAMSRIELSGWMDSILASRRR